MEDLQRQLQVCQVRAQESAEWKRRAEESDRRAEESDRRAEESDRRAAGLQRKVAESIQRSEASDQRAVGLQRLLGASARRAEACDRRAEESYRRATGLEREVAKSLQRAQVSDKRAASLQHQLAESVRRADEYDRRAASLQRQVAESVHRAQAPDNRIVELQTQLERSVRESTSRLQVMERSLADKTRQLQECEDRLHSYDIHWIVGRGEIELTGPQLGVGGWATVTVAKFRGAAVAVKRIHNQIISHHNIRLFQREMTMAARLRHPNLVQFLGATMEGEMLIIMELMSTSLRSKLQKDVFFIPPLVMSISLDVARALTYLHQIQPDAVVHRDISSANVLLEQLFGDKWRAKVTDYGSVNIVRQLNTQNPGCPVYSAPEASNPSLQSPKMDIFSFGALVLEMLTGRLPAPDDRPGLLGQVHHKQLLDLIERCLSERPEDRPSASAIISELGE